MTKTKTYDEYIHEKTEALRNLQEKIHVSDLQISRAEHQLQRAENLEKYIRACNRKKRNSRLIHKGIAIETLCPASAFLSDLEFFDVMKDVFSDPALQREISRITSGRAEAVEERM